MKTVWDLDKRAVVSKKRELFISDNGYDKNTHPKFKVGQIIEFYTGYNDHIRARASIKGINGQNLFVYNDCYWFPIQDDEKRKISIVKE